MVFLSSSSCGCEDFIWLHLTFHHEVISRTERLWVPAPGEKKFMKSGMTRAAECEAHKSPMIQNVCPVSSFAQMQELNVWTEALAHAMLLKDIKEINNESKNPLGGREHESEFYARCLTETRRRQYSPRWVVITWQ